MGLFGGQTVSVMDNRTCQVRQRSISDLLGCNKAKEIEARKRASMERAKRRAQVPNSGKGAAIEGFIKTMSDALDMAFRSASKG